jgi:hypothetical protein
MNVQAPMFWQNELFFTFSYLRYQRPYFMLLLGPDQVRILVLAALFHQMIVREWAQLLEADKGDLKNFGSIFN